MMSMSVSRASQEWQVVSRQIILIYEEKKQVTLAYYLAFSSVDIQGRNIPYHQNCQKRCGL